MLGLVGYSIAEVFYFLVDLWLLSSGISDVL